MPRLTRRGFGLLVAVAVLFGAGQWLGYPVLLALAATGAGALVAALLVGAHRPRVTVTREVYPDRVARGGAALARLRVRNTGPRSQPGFTAADRVGAKVRQVVVRPLGRGATADYSYELPTDVRGRHQVGPLRLDREDVLGLGRNQITAGQAATLWVQPRTLPMRPIAGGLLRNHYEGPPSAYAPRGSMDLREVREYVPGDEVRHLHWKATARTGQLMVREYADPNQPKFTTLLDTRVASMPAELFEDAVDLAASLVVSAVRADYRCRLLTTCGIDVASAPGALSSGRRMLDELCELERASAADLPLVSDPLAGGGGLAVVMADVGAADRAALAAAEERFSTVVLFALGGRSDPAIPGVRVLRAASVREAVDRWNTVIAR